MIKMAKVTIIIFLKEKNKCVVRSIEIKKKNIKGEKHIAQMDVAEYLRKWDVPENSKVYYGRFLRNGLHERLVKVH